MGKEGAMAEKRAYRGSMTVFFSVLTVLFLALISAMAESVRVQGARAKAVSVLDLGIFSVLGEYERDLLEEYEVFGVDASYGGEDFQKEKLSERLDFFMKYNIEPTRGTMAEPEIRCFRYGRRGAASYGHCFSLTRTAGPSGTRLCRI